MKEIVEHGGVKRILKIQYLKADQQVRNSSIRLCMWHILSADATIPIRLVYSQTRHAIFTATLQLSHSYCHRFMLSEKYCETERNWMHTPKLIVALQY